MKRMFHVKHPLLLIFGNSEGKKDGNNKNCKTRTKFAGNINDYLGRFGASYT